MGKHTIKCDYSAIDLSASTGAVLKSMVSAKFISVLEDIKGQFLNASFDKFYYFEMCRRLD